MVKCRLCGKKVILRRIEEREQEEEEEPKGMYYEKPMNLYAGRQQDVKMVQVKIYGCSDPMCISLEMTEKESQSHGF
jgi:hypothetical protein